MRLLEAHKALAPLEDSGEVVREHTLICASSKDPLRLYWGSIKALLRLYYGSSKALLRLRSIKALVRL